VLTGEVERLGVAGRDAGGGGAEEALLAERRLGTDRFGRSLAEILDAQDSLSWGFWDEAVKVLPRLLRGEAAVVEEGRGETEQAVIETWAEMLRERSRGRTSFVSAFFDPPPALSYSSPKWDWLRIDLRREGVIVEWTAGGVRGRGREAVEEEIASSKGIEKVGDEAGMEKAGVPGAEVG
jgi:hypothetical protein